MNTLKTLRVSGGYSIVSTRNQRQNKHSNRTMFTDKKLRWHRKRAPGRRAFSGYLTKKVARGLKWVYTDSEVAGI